MCGDGEIGPDIVDLKSVGSPVTLIERIRAAYSHFVTRDIVDSWTSTVQEGYAKAVISGVKHLFPSFQPDMLEMDESFGSAGLVAHRLKIPVIVRLHGPYFINGVAMGEPQDSAFYHRVGEERKTILGACGITVPSLDLLERVRREYSEDLTHAEVIPNPAPTVSVAHQWRQQNTDRNLILFVGRFDRHKGGDLALRAFAKLATKRSSVRLVFIGPDRDYRTSDGRSVDLQEFLDEHVRDGSIRARMEHLGQIPATEIRPHRLRAAVTIVASRYENFPMTVLEALAHGCPLVAPRTGGIPEIVRHEVNGLLFEPGDVDGLTNCMIRMLDAPEAAARWGKQGAEDIRLRFSRSVIARQTAVYYERFLKNSLDRTP